jgi:hypothetical protein
VARYHGGRRKIPFDVAEVYRLRSAGMAWAEISYRVSAPSGPPVSVDTLQRRLKAYAPSSEAGRDEYAERMLAEIKQMTRSEPRYEPSKPSLEDSERLRTQIRATVLANDPKLDAASVDAVVRDALATLVPNAPKPEPRYEPPVVRESGYRVGQILTVSDVECEVLSITPSLMRIKRLSDDKIISFDPKPPSNPIDAAAAHARVMADITSDVVPRVKSEATCAQSPAEPPLEPLPAVPTEEPKVEMKNIDADTQEFFLTRVGAGITVTDSPSVVSMSYWHESLGSMHPFATAKTILVVINGRPEDLVFLASLASSPIQPLCRIVSEQGGFNIGHQWWYDSHASGASRPDRWSSRNAIKFADWIRKYPALPPATDVRRIRELCNALPPRPQVYCEPQLVTVPAPVVTPGKSKLPPLAEGSPIVDGKGTGFAF